jgi:hypothetical protein
MMPLALLPSRSAAAAIGTSSARRLVVRCTFCRAISSAPPTSAPTINSHDPDPLDDAKTEERQSAQHRHRLSRPGYSYLPKKILLLRHGRSLGNDDETLFARLPDWKIPLSDEGKLQARQAGATIQRIVGEGTPIMFYVSPYRRTKQTYDELQHHVTSDVLFTREEPRLREVRPRWCISEA